MFCRFDSSVTKRRERPIRASRIFGYVAIAVALTGAFTPEAFAQSESPFLINGVPPDNGQAVAPTTITDPFGNGNAGQELGAVNGGDTKFGNINIAPLPVLAFTNPTGKQDFRKVYLQTANAANGDTWLYFAWERDASVGSGLIGFEFQQGEVDPACVYNPTPGIDFKLPQTAGETALINTCNPWKNRQAGDFIILWDQTGSSFTPADPTANPPVLGSIFKRTYNGTSWGPPESLGTAIGAFSGDNFKGEAAINLTEDVFPEGNECVNFANIIPETVTGNSDTADIKDTVFADFPTITNCGIVTVTKVTTTAGGMGSFPYQLARTNGDDVRVDGTTEIDETLINDGDSDEHIDLLVGTNYTLAENLAVDSPWTLVSIVCGTTDVTAGEVFAVVAGATTACTITNRPRVGKLTVIKHVITDNGGTAVASNFEMSLGNAAGTHFPGSETGIQTTMDSGTTYSVTETGPDGYQQVSAVGDCSGTISDGDDKLCTITNDDIAAHLIVIKHVINDNGGTKVASEFTLTIGGVSASGGNSVTGTEAPGVDKTLLSVGSFSVTESNSLGYTQSSVGCTGTIALGETKTCTITNDDAKASPGVVTAMSWVLKDQGTLSGLLPGAQDPGTIIFTLYKGTVCNASTLVHTEPTQAAAANGTYNTVVNYLVNESQAGQYRWVVNYSGNQFNNASESPCGDEVHTITVQ